MLRYNDNTGSFILYTEDVAAAEIAGLTLSTSTRGPQGEKVFFTADHRQRPEFNPYAVLEFFDQADDDARAKLLPLIKDYESSWSDGYDAGYPCPPGKEFLPYQQAGINYVLGRDNSIIGDEPGLGKTIQAIGVANALDARRVLIVCPASIRLGWQREIHSWSTLHRVSTNPILTGSHGVSPFANYVIVSYDLLRNDSIHKTLRSAEWDLGATKNTKC